MKYLVPIIILFVVVSSCSSGSEPSQNDGPANLNDNGTSAVSTPTGDSAVTVATTDTSTPNPNPAGNVNVQGIQQDVQPPLGDIPIPPEMIGDSIIQLGVPNLESGEIEPVSNTTGNQDMVASIVKSTIDGDGFQIDFPQEPEISTQSFESNIGHLQTTTYMYTTDFAVLMLAYTDYPKTFMDTTSTDTLMVASRQAAMQKLGIETLESSSKGSYKGFTTLDFRGVSPSSGYYMTYRVLLDGFRLYQLAIVQGGGYPSVQERGYFFDSFEISN